ncbi:MAG: GNAT family N-acetyltransferase [Candidatus Saccharimonadales bacterium]
MFLTSGFAIIAIMKTVIRIATLDDLPALSDLGTELMISEKNFDPQYNQQWYHSAAGKKYLLREVSGKNHICFLAEIDGRAVGYASCKMLPVDSSRPLKRAELDNLVTSEKYRMHGIGHELVDAFKKWAAENGAKRIKVIVNAYNEGGIKFYENTGFREQQRIMEAEL